MSKKNVLFFASLTAGGGWSDKKDLSEKYEYFTSKNGPCGHNHFVGYAAGFLHLAQQTLR